jgi:hypothetical protein
MRQTNKEEKQVGSSTASGFRAKPDLSARALAGCASTRATLRRQVHN